MYTGSVCLLLALAIMAGVASGKAGEGPAAQRNEPMGANPDPAFLRDCAFVCVDLQPGGSSAPIASIPAEWQRAGITLDDARAAQVCARTVCLPNARRAADACRSLGMPMVFVHWGYRFRDGMDLAPALYKSFRDQFGPDTRKWPHHIDSADSRPAAELGVREGDYVIAKSDQDAFTSSNIGFVLKNLGVRNIVFVGGHAGACLGKTAASAKRHGYRTLCVVDATNDAAESRRLPNLRATGYDHMVTTDDLVALASRAKRNPATR
jgi:nicotinamidase-related amidase